MNTLPPYWDKKGSVDSTLKMFILIDWFYLLPVRGWNVLGRKIIRFFVKLRSYIQQWRLSEWTIEIGGKCHWIWNILGTSITMSIEMNSQPEHFCELIFCELIFPICRQRYSKRARNIQTVVYFKLKKAHCIQTFRFVYSSLSSSTKSCICRSLQLKQT